MKSKERALNQLLGVHMQRNCEQWLFHLTSGKAPYLIFFFFFVTVLGFEISNYTLSHSTSLLL
jgi:hypothetical protein